MIYYPLSPELQERLKKLAAEDPPSAARHIPDLLGYIQHLERLNNELRAKLNLFTQEARKAWHGEDPGDPRQLQIFKEEGL